MGIYEDNNIYYDGETDRVCTDPEMPITVGRCPASSIADSKRDYVEYYTQESN